MIVRNSKKGESLPEERTDLTIVGSYLIGFPAFYRLFVIVFHSLAYFSATE